MFWLNSWMIQFLVYCHDTNFEEEDDNDYGQFVILDLD
jgi:hypothetical protein